MLDTTEAAITQAKVFHELFVGATPCTKPQTPLTTSHSIFMSWAAANRPEVEKFKKKYTITIGMDLNSDIMGRLLWLIWAKEALFFCRSFFLFVCSLLLQYFKRYCVFLQVYKWAPLFLESIMSRAGYLLIRSSISKHKDLEFREEFSWTQSMEYLTSNKNLA